MATDDLYAHLREAGDRGRKRVTGRPPADPPHPVGGVYDLGDKVIFGDVWQRPGLPFRDRRLVTITVLGMIGDERPLAIHIRGALESGDLTAEEIEAFSVHFAFYAGFPRATKVLTVLNEQVAALAAERGE